MSQENTIDSSVCDPVTIKDVLSPKIETLVERIVRLETFCIEAQREIYELKKKLKNHFPFLEL